ncbi:ATP-dependent nuclease [Flavobacterium sp. 245]|uniref:ATP-dependent nuclease n=1 Tax=Flavobacterium sp. 245 TaxID=2512115 RepID=UPI001062216B|nr:AAA family ATPase [Flavobacterium sp. 245]TDO96112.1 putative ATP-dependent endonuclease of OLD family [Flavobacterium sp. 245]
MKSPYISRVQIKNFRNFENVDCILSHKQVIIGENNVGKTNFLRAIQLILDRSFSDLDRELNETDFFDGLENPMSNGEEIIIAIEISNYAHNNQLLAQFPDALINPTDPRLRFTYKYFPNKNLEGKVLGYSYIIFQGTNEENFFTRQDREFINITVIGALRDVVKELNGNKRSPLYKLIQNYNIPNVDLEEIASSMSTVSQDILNLEEIKDIKHLINLKFNILSGTQRDNEIKLSPYDVDIDKLLYTMQIYLGLKGRSVSELSLGLSNILYLTLMLLLLEDKTIPRIINKELFDELIKKEGGVILNDFYDITENENKYKISETVQDLSPLYSFLSKNLYVKHSTTFLAIEEPESHLHPVLQRLLYREVLHKSETSVLFTTHSPYISSVSPLDSIVRIARNKYNSTISATAKLDLSTNEKIDLERYLDAKRGEILFGKGVIIVEGITEEYIIPELANLMGISLDSLGIIVCNVHSTNFYPYVKLLIELDIPWVIVTDGDYYETEQITVQGKLKNKKYFHRHFDPTSNYSFAGLNNISKLLQTLKLLDPKEVTGNLEENFELLKTKNCHIGRHTFEVDSMIKSEVNGNLIFKKIYSELRPGGEGQQKNFDDALESNNYWLALERIEGNISKGRFAQRLASNIKIEMAPDNLIEAIVNITKQINSIYE